MIDKNISSPVLIVLSTYNGALYLRELLNSLIDQDYSNFRVLIRDDGSSDATLSITEHYCKKYPKIFVTSKRLVGNVGVTRSFLSLLDDVEDGTYLMFCDQDDVWFENKISSFMDRMREVEFNISTPTMVFGDMVVTDKHLNVVAHSFWKYQRINTDIASDWRRLLVSNVVTGCSSMLNFAAVLHLRNVPVLNVLHDHLSAIVVARHGTLSKLTKPTMFYRQHHSNLEGARSFGLLYLINRIYFFLKVIFPRYRQLCYQFDLSLTTAIYLKFETVLFRLLSYR